MRILHISTPTGWRGGEQQVAHLINGLADEIEFQILIAPLNSELQKKMESSVTYIGYERKGSINLCLARLIKNVCVQHKIDLIHAHDSHAHTAAFLAAVIFRNKTPIVLSRRVDFMVSSNLFSNWKYNHSSIKSIITVSEAIKTILLPVINKKEIIKVVYDCIDLSRYQDETDVNYLKGELNLPLNTKLIGNLSALANHKDYFTFIRTAKLLISRHNDMHFVIAGDGPLSQLIINNVKAQQLDKHFSFLGFRTDVPKLLKSLDLFLMTSKREGLGSIILEALACGVPVVATIAGGIPEIVRDGETGLTAKIGDENALAEAIEKILDNPDFKKKLVENATKFVKQFSVEKTALQTKAIYQSLLK